MKINPGIPTPFPHSYWVVPGKLMAGYYPGDMDPKEAEKKLRGLIAAGIRHVINLMECNELDWHARPFKNYVQQMAAIASEMNFSVTLERHPVKDMNVPTRQEMIRILNKIDASIYEGKPVYLHCLGGRGRTGTVDRKSTRLNSSHYS